MECHLARDLAAARPARPAEAARRWATRPGTPHQVQQLPRRRRPPQPAATTRPQRQPRLDRLERAQATYDPSARWKTHSSWPSCAQPAGVRRGSGIRRAIPDNYHHGRPNDPAARFTVAPAIPCASSRPRADLPARPSPAVQIADLPRTSNGCRCRFEVSRGWAPPRPKAGAVPPSGTGQLHTRPRLLAQRDSRRRPTPWTHGGPPRAAR